MTVQEFIKEIRTFCVENANPENVAKYARYFKGEFNAYGVPSELQLAKAAEFGARPDIDLKLIYEAAPEALRSGKYEEGSFIYLLLKGKLKELDGEAFGEISKMFDVGFENWAHTDVVSGDILSPLLMRGAITRSELQEWRTSPRTYKRRASVVALIKPLKKDKDVESVLNFIEPLMLDREEKVGQALGWILREAWKIKPSPVEEFLLKYKNDSQRVIFQYATEKMPKEQRLRFKKEKN